MSTGQTPVLTHIYPNGCGHIILNRPSKYNALTFGMLEFLLETLLNWRDNNDIKFVLFTSNCSKAFCGGGDIEELAESIINPKTQGFYAWQFIFVEYRLDLLIASYIKPIISFVDGYIMGGGCGLSINSLYNVITENAICAMPECSIYWFPDCLFTYYLHSNMPHCIGQYIGLTGYYLDYKDIIYTKLAKYYIKQNEIESLQKQLLTENITDIESLLKEYSSSNIKELEKEKGEIEEMKDIINDCFGGIKLNHIINRLQYTSNNDNNKNIRKWAINCYNKILKTSPLSLKITMKLINDKEYNTSIAKHASIIFNVGVRMLDKYNFYDGVKKWRAKKNNKQQIFDESFDSFPYHLRHKHESSNLLDNGILSVFLELDARYSWKLQYDQQTHILNIIHLKINHRPSSLNIHDIIHRKNKSKL